MSSANPLVRERDVDFLLHEVHDVMRLCQLPAFAHHDRETFDLFLESAARLARERLFPLFKAMDEAPAVLEGGRVRVHPAMDELWGHLCELGILSAGRPEAVGGAELPSAIATMGYLYLMAGNGAAVGYALLTSGAAHLIESFGDETLRRVFMERMYAGEWTGTMALTEPQAGSSLGDLTTRATPVAGREGVYRIQGSKIFISGGDHDFRENVVHLVLARRLGDSPGTRGISLFVVPRRRPVGGDLEASELEDNDVATSQLVHKIGWRGLPSLGLSFGEVDDCLGWLLGQPGHGLSYMFQMMNEARLLVGANAVATASAAFHESLAYARERLQGRPLGARGGAPTPIVAHADVRRMLLRQKAIVEGGISLLIETAAQADLAAASPVAEERERARLLLDLLTPVTKTFAAERGFESTSLALQIHGGYGYSSEYLPELWLREQRLNSIHEGTTGIQSLDLLGRKVVASGGRPLLLLREEIDADVAACRALAADDELADALVVESDRMIDLTQRLGARGLAGEVTAMLAHSVDYLTLVANLIIGWQWLRIANAARRGLVAGKGGDDEFLRGKIEAARYWIRTELADNARLARLCADAEPSFVEIPDGGF
ncbi:MAG: acyl-CoA dehydrogenase [Myxococcales bacterium]|nr:acyl-CoA dehydrogenase [Myxococcales bacterium]